PIERVWIVYPHGQVKRTLRIQHIDPVNPLRNLPVALPPFRTQPAAHRCEPIRLDVRPVDPEFNRTIRLYRHQCDRMRPAPAFPFRDYRPLPLVFNFGQTFLHAARDTRRHSAFSKAASTPRNEGASNSARSRSMSDRLVS